jgi:hypothetical protein
MCSKEEIELGFQLSFNELFKIKISFQLIHL